jgi:hypothetical protein
LKVNPVEYAWIVATEVVPQVPRVRRRSMDEPIILLMSDEGLGYRVVGDCKWKIRTFVERDAYGDFDYGGGYLRPPSDVITLDQVHAMNRVMMARSPIVAWEKFTGMPLDELRVIPHDLDLCDSTDAEVRTGNETIKQLARRLMGARGIAEVGATYVLHLLRPRFVSLCSPYVRQCLNVPDSSSESAQDRLQTVLAVQRGMRWLAKANKDALDELSAYVGTLSTVTPTLGVFAGQSVPVRLTKLRILDIVLWAEVAIHFESHSCWSHWYSAEVGD